LDSKHFDVIGLEWSGLQWSGDWFGSDRIGSIPGIWQPLKRPTCCCCCCCSANYYGQLFVRPRLSKVVYC